VNKRQAKAIIACSLKLQAAVDSCLKQLSPEDRQYAEAYWATHIRSIANGSSYGGMPIEQALAAGAQKATRCTCSQPLLQADGKNWHQSGCPSLRR
jgi:hypothetical protein